MVSVPAVPVAVELAPAAVDVAPVAEEGSAALVADGWEAWAR
jgi:hypothetical protein